MEEQSTNKKFSGILAFVQNFNVTDDEILKLVYPFLCDKLKHQELFNLNYFLYSNDAIHDKCNELNDKSFNIKSYDAIPRKIKLLHTILEQNDIQLLEFKDSKFILTDEQYNLLKILFRTTTKKPETQEKIIKLMVSLYKNILSEQAIETTHIKKNIKENGKEK